MKICKTCKENKEFDNFGKNKYSKDGWNYECNSCRANYELQRRIKKGIIPKVKPAIIGDSHKECLMCKNILSVSNFRDSKRGRLGKRSYCKDCDAIYHEKRKLKDPVKLKESHRKYTQKYRDNHREHWRGLHRINQFNRKNLIKASQDGTVNEKFMKALYEIDKCYWCGNVTPEDKRTAEHIIPLSKGGIHGASNLTMACSSCNSSKLNFKNI